MKVQLLEPLNYFETLPLDSIRPASEMPAINAPPKEVNMADNSVYYPIATELVVEPDNERQQGETDANIHWFKNDNHPGGFSIAKNAYKKLS